MELVWLVLLFIAIFLAVKVAIFIIKGAIKLAFIIGLTALIFYLITHVNLLSLIH